MKNLTHMQRCLASIAGRELDKIPLYTPTIASDVASRMLGREAHTGCPAVGYALAKARCQGENAYNDMLAQSDEDLIDLNRLLGAEVIRYGLRNYLKNPVRQLDEYSFLCGDENGIYQIYEYLPESVSFMKTFDNAVKLEPEDWPQKAKKMVEENESAVSRAKSVNNWERALQKRLGDEMLVLAKGGNIGVGTDEISLMASMLEPSAVADILDCQLNIAMAIIDDIADDGILKVLTGGGDLADNKGLMYSPQTFRELMLPRVKKLGAYAKSKGIHYIWRTDGNIWDIGDDIFIESEINGFGEVDYNASMTAARLRERYPELVIWANCAGDTMLRNNTEEVYFHAMQILEGAGNTRHFHGCSNAILPGTPPENVWVMIEARNEYSKNQNKG